MTGRCKKEKRKYYLEKKVVFFCFQKPAPQPVVANLEWRIWQGQAEVTSFLATNFQVSNKYTGSILESIINPAVLHMHGSVDQAYCTCYLSGKHTVHVTSVGNILYMLPQWETYCTCYLSGKHTVHVTSVGNILYMLPQWETYCTCYLSGKHTVHVTSVGNILYMLPQWETYCTCYLSGKHTVHVTSVGNILYMLPQWETYCTCYLSGKHTVHVTL